MLDHRGKQQAEAAEHIMGKMWSTYDNQTRINVMTYAMINTLRT
jgi:hypothetical protein